MEFSMRMAKGLDDRGALDSLAGVGVVDLIFPAKGFPIIERGRYLPMR